MEGLEVNRNFWRGKRVFLTGHTGFKGGWLSLWLADMGAEVHGFSLEPPTEPSLFAVGKIEKYLASNTIGDIRNESELADALVKSDPQIVFHLAAQTLVRHSYLVPLETFATNVLGTANLLESCRLRSGISAVVNVTTDKCYENQEWVWPYRESEPLGGYDPYSSSKACAELVTAAYRRSYLASEKIHLASARAGNVIGGGDWAKDRLVPDFLRAVDDGRSLVIRSPLAIRPWQHVLEPLSGYLLLAEALAERGDSFAAAWNFGPEQSDTKSVEWVVNELCSMLPGASWSYDSSIQPHEAQTLKLDISKAKCCLGWQPRWDLSAALEKTIEWYEAWRAGEDMARVSVEQIREFERIGLA